MQVIKVIFLAIAIITFGKIKVYAQKLNSNISSITSKEKIKKVVVTCGKEKGEMPFSGDARFTADTIFLELYGNGQKSEVFIILDSLVSQTQITGTILYRYEATIKLDVDNVSGEKSTVWLQEFDNKKILKINSPFEEECFLDIEIKKNSKK